MNLRIYLLATLFQLHAPDTLAALPHVKCVQSYRKLGCYNAVSGWQLLITDRDKHSPKYDGHNLDWHKFEESIHSLACRCAQVARKKNFRVFGLQNYAECWSGPGADKSYDSNGPAQNCLMILRNPLPPCDVKDSKECMGAPKVNFMFRLDEDHCKNDPCKNGGTCVALAPRGYKCDCLKGFTGTHCEADVDECRTQTCQNGGTCVNTNGSFYCRCSSGYRGALCEKGECISHGIYDIGVIIDGSNKAGSAGFTSTKLFLLNLIHEFFVGVGAVHFGIIVNSARPHLVCAFSNEQCYRSQMHVKFSVLQQEFPDGDTRTDQALRMARKKLYSISGGDRPEVPNVLVVITNGNTVEGSQPYDKVLKPLKDRDVNIIAVGVGSEISKAELNTIAMGRKEHVIQVDKIENLRASDLHNMIEDIC